MGASRRCALVQGAWFALTGVWPIVHLPSFVAVTGPKTDVWLVHTVGATVAAVGVALLAGARRDPPSLETAVLGVGSALALGLIDVVYTANGTLRAVYAADAAVEGAFVVWWVVAIRRDRRRG